MASSSSSQTPSSLPQAMEDGEYRNWAELPLELTSSILQRLGAIEILENAQKVCTSWRRVCKDPSMWRKIVMHDDLGDFDGYELEIMCRHAVDRSQGGLVEIDISYFGTDELLTYIADSSSNLRSLKLANCYTITNEGLIEAVVKLPLLEDLELEVSYCSLSGESLKAVGKSCPNLKTLKLIRGECPYYHPHIECDDDAFPIAETMPGLRHLQLIGNPSTNAGLNAILDNCPNLEHLDLSHCFNMDIVGDLEKRCSQSIKVFRLPNASTDDFPFDARFVDLDSSEDDDYPSDAMVIDTDSSEDHDDLYYDPYDH